MILVWQRTTTALYLVLRHDRRDTWIIVVALVLGVGRSFIGTMFDIVFLKKGIICTTSSSYTICKH